MWTADSKLGIMLVDVRRMVKLGEAGSTDTGQQWYHYHSQYPELK